MIIIIKMIEVYCIVAQPYIAGEPIHTASKQSHRIPHLRIYRLTRKCFVTRYVRPVMQQYESRTIYKELL